MLGRKEYFDIHGHADESMVFIEIFDHGPRYKIFNRSSDIVRAAVDDGPPPEIPPTPNPTRWFSKHCSPKRRMRRFL